MTQHPVTWPGPTCTKWSKVAPLRLIVSGLTSYASTLFPHLQVEPMTAEKKDAMTKDLQRLIPEQHRGQNIHDFYPPAVITFAEGHRVGDDDGCGPGVAYVKHLTDQLAKAGVGAVSGGSSQLAVSPTC